MTGKLLVLGGADALQRSGRVGRTGAEFHGHPEPIRRNWCVAREQTGGGGIPPWGANAGPARLLTGLPAGFAYLAQGLLGYLNPSTYLGATWGIPC